MKGLEAPIVVLADTTSPPDSKRHHPKLMPLIGSALQPFVWATGEDSTAIEEARAEIVRANEGEHRRLLYVALTRARDAIVVAGAEAKRSANLPDGCWYGLVRGALEKEQADFREISDHGYGFEDKVFRWRYRPGEAVAETSSPASAKFSEPPWLRASSSDSSGTPRAHAAAPIILSGAQQHSIARADARRRGILIHRLLQELPRFDAKEREARAKRYLASATADLAESARAAIAAEAIKVIGRPELAELFGPASHAEVAILGQWNEGEKPFEDFGRVDRLAITKDEVWIADFKSDALPPSRAADTPDIYLMQLSRYRAILARIYPGRAMRALVVWTANGAVHEIPGILLDKAFLRLTAA